GTRQGRICQTRLLPKDVFATNTRSSFRYSNNCIQSTCLSRGSNGYSNFTALTISSRCSELSFATAILDCISSSWGWTLSEGEEGGWRGYLPRRVTFFQGIGLLRDINMSAILMRFCGFNWEEWMVLLTRCVGSPTRRLYI